MRGGMNQATDVAIIGGGVIGCSIAYQLSKAGVQVSIIERAEIAAEPLALLPGYLLRIWFSRDQKQLLICF